MITDNIELDILNEISKIASSTLLLDERLKLIAEITSKKMGTGACNVSLLDDDKETLVLKASTAFKKESLGHVKLKIGTGVTGWVADRKKTLSLKNALNDSRFLFFPEIGEDKFKSLLSVPIMGEDHCIGVITVQTKDEREYSERDIALLKTISNQIYGTIKNSQLYQKATQRFSRLNLLHDIGQALSSTLELSDLFSLIVKNSCQITKSTGSAIWLKDKNIYTKKASCAFRNDIEFSNDFFFQGEKLRNKTRQIHYLLLKNNDKSVKKFVFSKIYSLLCIPLIYRNRTRGILCVVDKKEDDASYYSSFTKDDIQFLSTMANYAIIAIDNAYAYERLERLSIENSSKINELSTLYEISLAMQSTIRLNKLIRIILGCITAGGGVGFNRAMLLLVNEKTKTLQGLVGLETSTHKETENLWQKLKKKNQTLLEWLTSDETDIHKDSSYNVFVKSVRFNIVKKGCLFSKAVLDKKLYSISKANNNNNIDKTFLKKFGVNNFAIVPLIAKENVLGLVVVDNFFNKKQITENDLQFLNRFAIHAGWAIENSRLFSKLMEKNRELIEVQDRLLKSERLATIGRFSAEIAHEIKNPLVSIGGFARRLSAEVGEDTKEKQYSRIIVKEVERLEKMLANILSYSNVKNPELKSYDINLIIKETLSFYSENFAEKGIQVLEKFSYDIEKIRIDKHLITQVLINLFINSIDSMSSGGNLFIETKKSYDDVIFTIKDTGGGVPKEALHNIFDPFFTTKKSGTGLGLTLIRKIIESHGGSLEFENKPGVGIEFIIKLPTNNKTLNKKMINN